jgi:thiol-disulfide isomerase/thioredoxin
MTVEVGEPRPDHRVPLLAAALVAACALVVVLGLQNRRLRAAHAALAERADQPYVGMTVPVMPVRAVNGAPLELGAPHLGAQILYFYTTGCPFCRASIPAVVALAARAGGALVGVGAGSADELRAHARASGFAFPVVELDDRARKLFRADDVPLVLVVDRAGEVRYRHLGQVRTDDVDEIVAAAAIPAVPRALSLQPGVMQ